MVWIRIPSRAPAKRDIDLPPEVVHRSTSGGTLLLVPGYSKEITEQEWAFIKANHADLVPHIQVLSGGK